MHVYIVVKWASHWGQEIVFTSESTDDVEARDEAYRRQEELEILETDPRFKYIVVQVPPGVTQQ